MCPYILRQSVKCRRLLSFHSPTVKVQGKWWVFTFGLAIFPAQRQRPPCWATWPGIEVGIRWWKLPLFPSPLYPSPVKESPRAPLGKHTMLTTGPFTACWLQLLPLGDAGWCWQLGPQGLTAGGECALWHLHNRYKWYTCTASVKPTKIYRKYGYFNPV